MKDFLLLIQEFGPVAGLAIYMAWQQMQQNKSTPKSTPKSSEPAKSEADRRELIYDRLVLITEKLDHYVDKQETQPPDTDDAVPTA